MTSGGAALWVALVTLQNLGIGHAKMKIIACVFVALSLILNIVVAQSCSAEGNIRLLWGSGNWEGNVQICLNGVWGWVCHNSFSTVDAQVVCYQLGYSTSGAVARSGSIYGWGNGTIAIDYVGCTGTETSLTNCVYSTDLTSSCNFYTIAGVICQSGGTCNNQDIRLVSHPSYTSYRSYGRLEICRNNQWGTICDDGWDSTDANVACRHLGFDYGSSSCCANYGQGLVPISIRYVSCSSNSYDFSTCTYTANSVGCSHSEDAGVACYGRNSTTCTNGQVSLWRPYNNSGPTNEGIPLYCRSGQWYTVCRYSYSCYTAKLMCKKMGYAGALTWRTNYNTYYGQYHTSYYDSYYWSCSSSYTSLSQCSINYGGSYCCGYSWWGRCYRYCSRCSSSTALGLVCYSPSQGTNCTSGDVRLVNGTTSQEGRAEYCYEGNWTPFCGMSSATASAVCNHLGYNYTYGSVFNDERFGRSDKISSFNHKYCTANQLALSECTEVRKESTCYIQLSRCTTEYGVRCYNPGICNTDGQLRLVNGTIVQEGRVEICLDGVWGAICQTSWGSNDAFVFCKGLGYNGQGPLTYYGAHFGETYGPVIWNNMGCTGFESGIQTCNKIILPNFNCTQQNTAGVTCKDDCQNGDVKLTGGQFDNEGTVLVCYNRLWGLISDSGWSNGDARVICNQLGHSDGIAKPLLRSFYGKPQMPVHFRQVQCFPQNTNIMQCSKTTLSFANAKDALSTDDVAGVDCIYDEPRDCIRIPDLVNTPGTECSFHGQIRLQGSQEVGTGRLEYCYNGYWSPFCNLDPITASVACRQFGFTTYTAASIIPTTDYGVVRNFSFFLNISCIGTESSISQCAVHTSECTPWCPHTNIAIKCFNPGMCTNGDIRLADGVLENEGRLEICYNGVWGTVCDQGWDTTDAHVYCTQMGHPELEPYVLSNSTFGAGQYPIVYSNFGCGGFESSLADCTRQVYPQSSCSRNNVAGVLCGYDCNDGDVRLVGSEYSYEGTVEVCYDHIWGIISDSGWSIQDAAVVCRQLGYQVQGSVPYYNSHFGKPNKTVLLTDMLCTGNENSIDDCTRTTLSLMQGRDMLESTNAAGVKCFTPDWCITPPKDGLACTHGQVRLTGGRPMVAEGNLAYCYHGSWSSFCYLGPQEAIVACRQLGYPQYEVTAIFDDGRFGLNSVTSLFQNFTCESNPTASSLSDCDIIDSCQSNCEYPIGLRCYDSTTSCEDGAIRLEDGMTPESGRLEVCKNNIWGSVCGSGFDKTDAYVVCRELGLGISEPTVYTNSHFSDGNDAIIFSNFQCKGFEENVNECDKDYYDSFTCSRGNVVGIICQDNCSQSDIRLVDGPTELEGTLQVCYYNTWGVVSDNKWTDNEAKVVCRQLNYNVSRALAITGSHYGISERTVQLTDVVCTNGSQLSLDDCTKKLLTPSEGASFSLLGHGIAGVRCVPTVTVTAQPPPQENTGASTLSQGHSSILYAVIGIVAVVGIVLVLVVVSLVVYIVKQKKTNKDLFAVRDDVSMADLLREGVENPMAGVGVEDNYDDPKKLLQ